MASFAFFSGVNPNQALVDNETGYIGRDATVDGLISASASSVDLRIDGVLFNDGVPLNMTGTNNFLQVGRTGLIQANTAGSAYYAAVEFLVYDGAGVGTGRISNAGEIVGNAMAIYARAQDSDDILRIRNTDTGSIAGETDGIYLDAAGTVVIGNSGSIEGFRYGISNDFLAYLSDTTLILKNGGTVYGMDAAVQTGGGDDKIVNWGTLDGEVRLGGGADFFKNTNGIAIDQILLQDGDDRVIGNTSQEDVVDGGAGRDILDFRQQGGAIVALDDSFDTGGSAAGDTYTNFETIWGSRSGDDVLRGNGASNLLIGNGGNDRLDGAGGSDTLRGGIGTDTLTGGWGNDTFAYNTIDDFGDVILDFNSTGSGNDDRFAFTAAALGGGLVAGTLDGTRFQIRADNEAQDSNDRFIFRTTDKTLWFDVDGNAAKAAVMVADLQASAAMTSADIVLI